MPACPPARRPFPLLPAALLAAVALAAPSCSGSLAQGEPDAGLRVLFVGNSFTYANDLPALVAALAEAGGQAPLGFASVTFGNFSLEDHWNQGDAREAIARGGWDYVVLQQGPSALPESRVLLIDYTRRFAEEIRRAGARPVLYMVWPSQQRSGDFDGVSTSYRQAAEAVDGLLVPAGDAWRAAWRRDPALTLYSPDGLHPTLAGSYLAALVFYRSLYDTSPVGLPARLKGMLDLPEAQAAVLQAAAAETD
jgi:hypothetical protein